MAIEQDETTLEQLAEDLYAPEKEQIAALWQSLPAEHQVALALRFVDEIMAGDYRPYLQYLWAQQYPMKTQELERAYPTIEISEEDLLKANLDEEEAAMLTEKHRQQIAQTMRSHYIHDLFWPELQYLAQTMIMDINQD